MPYTYTISQMVNAIIDDYLAKKGAEAKDPEVVCLNQLKEAFANCRTRESLIEAIAVLEQTPLISAFLSDAMVMRDIKVSNRLPSSELVAQLKAREYWQTNKITPIKLKKSSAAFEDLLRGLHARTTKLLNDARVVPMTQKDLNAVMDLKKIDTTTINIDEVPSEGPLLQFLMDLKSPGISIEGHKFLTRQNQHPQKLAALKELAGNNIRLISSLMQIHQHIGAGLYKEFAASSIDLPETTATLNTKMGKLVDAEFNKSSFFQFEEQKKNVSDKIVDLKLLQADIDFRLFKDNQNQVYLQMNSTNAGYFVISEQKPAIQVYYDLANYRAMPHYADENLEAISKLQQKPYPTLEYSALMRFDYDEKDNMYKPRLISGYTAVNDQSIRLTPDVENKMEASRKTNGYSTLDQYQDHEIQNRITSVIDGLYSTKRPNYNYLVKVDGGLRPYFDRLNNGVMLNKMPLSAQNEMDKLITIIKFTKSNFSDMGQKNITYADFILFHSSNLTTAVLREFETNVNIPNVKGIAVDDFKTVTLHYYRDSQDRLMAKVEMNVYGFRNLDTDKEKVKVSVVDANTGKLQAFEPGSVAQAWKNNLDDYGQPKGAFKPIGSFILDVEIAKDKDGKIEPTVLNAVCTINTVGVSFKGEKMPRTQIVTEEASNVNNVNTAPQFGMGGRSS